jgi:hypothetical protein
MHNHPLSEQAKKLPAFVVTAFILCLDPSTTSPSRWVLTYLGPVLPTKVPHNRLRRIDEVVAYAIRFPEGFVLMNANLFAMLGFAVVITAQVASIVLIAQKVAKSPRASCWGESWEGLMWVCTMYAVAGAVIAPCMLLDFCSSAYHGKGMNSFILWGCVWLVLYVMLVLMACGLVKLLSWAKSKNMKIFVSVLNKGGWIAFSAGTALLTMCIGVNIPEFWQLWRDVQRMRNEIPWSGLGPKDMLHENLRIAQCLFLNAETYSKVLGCGTLPNLWQRVMDTHLMLFAIDQVLYFLIGHCFFCGSILATKVTGPQLRTAFETISRLGGNVPMIPQCMVFVSAASNICPQITGLITEVGTWIADSCFYLVVMNMTAKLRQQQDPKMPSGTSVGVCLFAGLLVLGLTVVVYRKVKEFKVLRNRVKTLTYRMGSK